MAKQGRPTEGIDTLWKGWQDDILTLYADGASDVEIKALIHGHRGSFSNDLWDRWLDEEAIFSETIKRGKLLSQVWWEKNGRKNLENKDFNYTGWYMNMKNRFKWTDRQEVTGDRERPLSIKVDLAKLTDEELEAIDRVAGNKGTDKG